MSDSYLSAGTRLRGRYEIIDEIGRGGFSVVYRATDHEVGAAVAIKLLVPPPAAAMVARERLRREVLAVRSLAHASVVRIFDLFDEGPWSLVVMELVVGGDLHAEVQQRGPLAPDRVAAVGRQVADALAHAHRRGILHRDLKPKNILLDEQGQARLTDFGSARLAGEETITRTGGFVGTVEYGAPEAFAGSPADARSDLYSLGMTLYFAATGTLPGRASPHLPPTPMPDGQRARVLRPDVPAWLDEAIAVATRARPGDRFATAALLADALGGNTPVAPSIATAEACLGCGGDDPLGTGICPACGPAEGEPTLVVVDAPATERTRIERHLAASFPGQPSAVREAAAGRRPLLEASRSAAQRAVEALASRQIATRTMAARRALRLLPRDLVVLAVAITVVGSVAGLLVNPTLLVTTPLVAASLLGLGLSSARAPLWRMNPARRPLAPVIAHLPAGGPRTLASDIARTGRELLERHPDPELAARVADLVAGAGAAAQALVGVDAAARRLEAARQSSTRPPAALLEAAACAEGARDGLLQRMLEALAALATAQSESARPALEELSAAAAELRSELGTQTAAVREVDALLGPD
jgi:hypothetical protein